MTSVERHPTGGDDWKVRCHQCKRKLTFSDVTYLMSNALAWRCTCDGKQKKLTRSHEHFEYVYDSLIEGWEQVRLPYTAAELPALPIPAIEHELNKMTMAMHFIKSPHEFEARCEEERRVPAPDSSDSDEGSE